MTKTITVTQADINAGKDRAYTNCPIALAMMRVFNTNDVYVDYSTSRVYSNGTLIEIKHTVRMKRFIDRFDNYQHVRPTSFGIHY